MWNSSTASSPLPEPRQRHHDPDRGVRVLAAVLADARRIALDVAGILRRSIERRRRAAAAICGPRAMSVRADGVHRALGEALRARRPTAPPRTARSSRSGTRRSAPSRAACRRRSSRAGTTRRPRPARAVDARRARLVAVARRRARASPRASHSGANSVEHACGGRSRARCSRRGPPRPTRFMPSFQSPLPISGRPCAPAVRPLSIARTQCSKSVPSSRGHARLAVGLRARPARAAAPSRNGTRSSRTPASPVVRT